MGGGPILGFRSSRTSTTVVEKSLLKNKRSEGNGN